MNLLSEGSTHVPYYLNASHLNELLDPRRLKMTLDKARQVLRHFRFDTIAFRGFSGALIAPSLAMVMGKGLLLVRKPSEKRHSDLEIEGDTEAERYVIVDDFVSSGETVSAIMDAVRRGTRRAKCIGVLETLYMPEEIDPLRPPELLTHKCMQWFSEVDDENTSS